MSDEHEIIEGEVEQPELTDTALSRIRRQDNLTPAEFERGLAEFDEKEKIFRSWLLNHLVEGVHYGYPPGCEPKKDEHGNILVWNRKRRAFDVVPKEQWRDKKPLYQSGADRISQLMGYECLHEFDNTGWDQLGGHKGMIVINCTVRLKSTGRVEGHGVGAAKVGEKNWDHNQASKMARKRAKVAAVLDATGLSDLFTQDQYDPDDVPPAAENPTSAADAPKAQPRAERVTKQTLLDLAKRWTEVFGDAPPEERRDWLADVSGIDPEQVTHLSAWTMDAVRKCYAQIDKESNDIPY